MTIINLWETKHFFSIIDKTNMYCDYYGESIDSKREKWNVDELKLK